MHDQIFRRVLGTTAAPVWTASLLGIRTVWRQFGTWRSQPCCACGFEYGLSGDFPRRALYIVLIFAGLVCLYEVIELILGSIAQGIQRLKGPLGLADLGNISTRALILYTLRRLWREEYEGETSGVLRTSRRGSRRLDSESGTGGSSQRLGKSRHSDLEGSSTIERDR